LEEEKRKSNSLKEEIGALKENLEHELNNSSDSKKSCNLETLDGDFSD